MKHMACNELFVLPKMNWITRAFCMTGYRVTKVLHGQWLKTKIDLCVAIGRSVRSKLRDPDGMHWSLWRRCRSAIERKSVIASSEVYEAVSEIPLESVAEFSAANRISLDTDSHSLQLVSCSGRPLSSSLYMLVIGGLFLGGGNYFFDYAPNGGSLFWLVGGVSSIMGLLFLWVGFWSWGLRLEVCMAQNKLRVKRSFFDKALYQHSVELPDADRIFAKRTSETVGNSELSKEYFSLVFRRDGVTHQLAEGIDGRHAAETLLSQVRNWLMQHRQQLSEKPHRFNEA